jgi:glycosyltransferase involved in cell wall biosynthesis
MKIPISIVIATFNESRNIQDCIRSVSDFDEIIVVDSGSTDGTPALSKALGAHVIDFRWNGRYPKKRQWILDNVKSRNDWIFFLDADERMPSLLRDELHELFLSGALRDFVAADVRMEFFWLGKRLKHGFKIRSRKLINRHFVKFPVIDDLNFPGMGEMEGHYQPEVRGRIYKLKNELQEKDSDPIESWMIRHVSYASWDASVRSNPRIQSLVDGNKTALSWLFYKLPFRPLVFFIYSYFIRFGFLDRRAGFDFAFGYSWYYWLSGVIKRDKSRLS